MDLETLKIRNFCGVKSFDLTLSGGKHADIYGDNATGKTTVANAFAWLFTGKNASGTAELDPQPLDSANGKIHNLETSVFASFSDGTEYGRVLSEVWSKKRGEAVSQLTGLKTSYYRNSVPMKEKEFNADIESMIGSAEVFRMLCAPSYFPQMDWKARRKILLEMCGDVSDADVIASSGELSELSALLGSHSVEEYLKIVKAKKSDLRRDIDLIPARISENENAAADGASSVFLPSIENEVKTLEEEENIVNKKLAAFSALNAKEDKKQALMRQREEQKTEFLRKFNTQYEEYNARLKALTTQRDNLFAQRSPLLVRQAVLPDEIKHMQSARAALIERTKKIKAEQYDGGDICPCCGQKLPAEQIEKAVAEFNRRKSEQLEAISAEAHRTCDKDMISAAESELNSLGEKIAVLTEQYNAAAEAVSAHEQTKPNGDFAQTDEYSQLTAAINSVSNEPDDANTALDELNRQLSVISAKLVAARDKLYKARAAEQCRKRIAELEEQQKALAAAYAECEKGEYLCELFIRTKVSLLDERINSRFKTLKFKLFHEQQNGGLQEICKVLIPCESGLVEYEKANNAAKINAGLEIIEALSEHYGVALPVFVDNAESVTMLSDIDSQTIRLYVSEADKRLNVKIE